MRLFFATSFPATVIDPLNELLTRMRPRLPSASWVRPETQHLTFAFLGEQPGTILDKLAPLIKSRLASIEKFEGHLHGCGFFPNPRHARVGWIGAQPGEKFEEIATAVRDSVKDVNVELDTNEFRPHLTLMRIRDRWPPMSIETFNKGLRDYKSEPFTVDRITLFESKLNPKGAVHTALREFELSSRAE